MTQVDDLSRCLVAFDQNTSLTVVVEMSEASWLAAGEQATGSPAQIAGSDMSETAPGPSTTASSGGLYDETGSPIPSQTELAHRASMLAATVAGDA